MEINVKTKIKPFGLPNYLNDGTIDVGTLSVAEAGELWDNMRKEWLEHVMYRKQILGRTKRYGTTV